MKYVLLIVSILSLFCCDESLDSFNKDPNLRKYLYRDDSLLTYAIKEIPGKGSIKWIANNKILTYKGKYGLVLTNYSDTTDWRNLYSWAYGIEHISIDLNPFQTGKINLVTKDEVKSNPALYSTQYSRYTAGGDILDASWAIDTNYQSMIIVDKFDTISKIAEGRYDLFYKLKKQNLYNGVIYDSLAHFKNGKFKALIVE